MALIPFSRAIGALKDSDTSGGTNYYVGTVVNITDLSDINVDLFSDRDGTTPLPQNGISNVTDAKGVFECFIAPGSYKVKSLGEEEEFDLKAGSQNAILSLTLSEAKSYSSATTGVRVKITDLGNDEFEYMTGQTDDEEEIYSTSILGLSLVHQNNVSINALIPTNFSTLQAAYDFYSSTKMRSNNTVNIIIEDGHLLTAGLGCRHGDYSNFKISQESGATVSLDPAFVGADTSGVPSGILGDTPRQPLIFGFDCKLPYIDCLFDMGGLYGTGIQLAESEVTVNQSMGVINAGFRGIQVHGRANIYGANFSGSEGTGIRLQQASSCSARNANADNCCKSTDLASASVYTSRSSVLEFRGGSAQNSGASGLIARRSIVTADDANFNGAADKGVECENNAQVSFANGSALNTASNSIRCIANGNVYAVGVNSSTTSSADNLNVDVGGVITIASSNQIEGNTGEANAIAESNVSYLNSFDEAGMIFYDGSNGTFKIESDANGIIQKFADGRMLTFINTSIDTGIVLSGDFSNQIAMPAQPSATPFVSINGSSMDVIGRSTAGGGGTRVCVNNFYRPTVLTGTAFRVENTGQQLDGTGTGQSIASINVSMITYGTWM